MPSSALKIPPPPRSTLFPYTTLFRSATARSRSVCTCSCATTTSARASSACACEDRKSTRLNSSHMSISYAVFCFKDTATTEIYTLSLHDALPICDRAFALGLHLLLRHHHLRARQLSLRLRRSEEHTSELQSHVNLVCRLLL